MFKKIILTSVTAMIATAMGTATANTAPYVGASVGVVTNTSDVKANGSNYVGGAYRGMPFNVFAGYAATMGQCFYLAGELFGTMATANLSDNTQLKSSYGFGASIVPGLMLSDTTLAYVRAGVLRSRFSSSVISNTQTGGQLGFGMQTSLTQNVDLRGEYDFVAYQAKNGSSGIASSSVAPRSDQFTVGLVYKF